MSGALGLTVREEGRRMIREEEEGKQDLGQCCQGGKRSKDAQRQVDFGGEKQRGSIRCGGGSAGSALIGRGENERQVFGDAGINPECLGGGQS